MRKIKVLHLITRLIIGGAQDGTLAMASGLDKDKFDVIVASGPQDFSIKMANKWNMNVIIIPHLIRQIHPVQDLMALVRLYFFIKKNRFDIIHTHTSKAGILGRLAAKLAGVPIIFHTPHGSIFHSIYYSPIYIFFLSKIENFAAFFTDKIIVTSDNERNDCLEHKIATKDKYMVIHYGIRQDNFLKTYDRVLKRKELGIPDDAILIGNIGRLVAEKGHLFCLEAFKMVVNKLPKAILLIVGDGILKPAIAAKIEELNLNDNVIMAGHREDVAEILGSLDISLHTSMWEGTPRAIMEAMAMGKAIVATNVGGVAELIRDGITGILVPPLDKLALFNAITRLINNQALAKKIGEAAHQCAKERFTLGLMMKDITKIYNNFIESKILYKEI